MRSHFCISLNLKRRANQPIRIGVESIIQIFFFSFTAQQMPNSHSLVVPPHCPGPLYFTCSVRSHLHLLHLEQLNSFALSSLKPLAIMQLDQPAKRTSSRRKSEPQDPFGPPAEEHEPNRSYPQNDPFGRDSTFQPPNRSRPPRNSQPSFAAQNDPFQNQSPPRKAFGRNIQGESSPQSPFGRQQPANDPFASPKPGFTQTGFKPTGFKPTDFGQAGLGQTGFGQTGFGQAGFKQTGFKQSGFPQSGFGQSGFGQTGFGRRHSDKQDLPVIGDPFESTFESTDAAPFASSERNAPEKPGFRSTKRPFTRSQAAFTADDRQSAQQPFQQSVGDPFASEQPKPDPSAFEQPTHLSHFDTDQQQIAWQREPNFVVPSEDTSPPQRDESRAQMYNANRGNRANRSHQLFFKMVPVPLFSRTAIINHFTTDQSAVVNVSLRGTRRADSHRTAMITFESEEQSAYAISACDMFQGHRLRLRPMQQPRERHDQEQSQRQPYQQHQAATSSTSNELLFTYIPQELFTQVKVIDLFTPISDGKLVDVSLRERSYHGTQRRTALLRFEDAEAAQAALDNLPLYSGEKLQVSFRYKPSKPPLTTHSADPVVQSEGFFQPQPQMSAAVQAPKTLPARDNTYQEKLAEIAALKEAIAKRESERQLLNREKSGRSERFASSRTQKRSLAKGKAETRESGKEKEWRSTGAKIDIRDAKALVGACKTMCPLKEFEQRIEQRDIHGFEKLDGDPKFERAVKKYRRSAAISEQPKPEDIRPPHVLERTMTHLKTVCDYSASFADIHNFVRDRTRSVRQDYTYQGVVDEGCIRIHEECVRFHILSEHRLHGHDAEVFSSRQNVEQLSKCLISLRQMYSQRREDNNPSSPNEPEIQAYYILTQMSDPRTCVQLMTSLAPEVRQSSEVEFALSVVKATSTSLIDFTTFFSCMREGPYLMTCLMQAQATEMRMKGLQVINAAHGNASSSDHIELAIVTRRLGFDTEQEARTFCEAVGMSFKDHHMRAGKICSECVMVVPSCTFKRTPPENAKCEWAATYMEAKVSDLAPSEIIEGGPQDKVNKKAVPKSPAVTPKTKVKSPGLSVKPLDPRSPLRIPKVSDPSTRPAADEMTPKVVPFILSPPRQTLTSKFAPAKDNQPSFTNPIIPKPLSPFNVPPPAKIAQELMRTVEVEKESRPERDDHKGDHKDDTKEQDAKEAIVSHVGAVPLTAEAETIVDLDKSSSEEEDMFSAKVEEHLVHSRNGFQDAEALLASVDERTARAKVVRTCQSAKAVLNQSVAQLMYCIQTLEDWSEEGGDSAVQKVADFREEAMLCNKLGQRLWEQAEELPSKLFASSSHWSADEYEGGFMQEEHVPADTGGEEEEEFQKRVDLEWRKEKDAKHVSILDLIVSAISRGVTNGPVEWRGGAYNDILGAVNSSLADLSRELAVLEQEMESREISGLEEMRIANRRVEEVTLPPPSVLGVSTTAEYIETLARNVGFMLSRRALEREGHGFKTALTMLMPAYVSGILDTDGKIEVLVPRRLLQTDSRKRLREIAFERILWETGDSEETKEREDYCLSSTAKRKTLTPTALRKRPREMAFDTDEGRDDEEGVTSPTMKRMKASSTPKRGMESIRSLMLETSRPSSAIRTGVADRRKTVQSGTYSELSGIVQRQVELFGEMLDSTREQLRRERRNSAPWHLARG